MTQDQRELRVRQNLAQINQILEAMDTMAMLVENLRDETDALVQEGRV